MLKRLKLLQDNRSVKQYTVLDFKTGKEFYYFKIKVELKDDSILYIREYISRGDTEYSYHLQKKSGELICRWDNAPHHKNLITFPHHKHFSDNIVAESYEINLEKVLDVIAGNKKD